MDKITLMFSRRGGRDVTEQGKMFDYFVYSDVKPDHKNKKPRHIAKNHGTNFFHIKFS
jgi:hypothetical protein